MRIPGKTMGMNQINQSPESRWKIKKQENHGTGAVKPAAGRQMVELIALSHKIPGVFYQTEPLQIQKKLSKKSLNWLLFGQNLLIMKSRPKRKGCEHIMEGRSRKTEADAHPEPVAIDIMVCCHYVYCRN